MYGPLMTMRISGSSSSSGGTKFDTTGCDTPTGNSGRSTSRRSRIASRVICTSAFGSSVTVIDEVPSRDSLLVRRTPRTPCTAASIGDVTYISTSSAAAPL